MKSCVVVFPLYKVPDETELAFMTNGLTMTTGFKQVIVAPEGLNVDHHFGPLEQLEVKRFAKHYFEGITGYNQLLLSPVFYRAFSLYDYILIHQADVFLFKQELGQWCEKGYDYIGAPWFRPDKLNKGKIFNLFQQLKLKFKRNKRYAGRHNQVGNGGLSLRKVSSSLEILAKVDPNLLRRYTEQQGDAYNEDIFWSLEAPQLGGFKIPGWEEAMHFAVEFHPRLALEYLNGELPFGCHAPLKHEPQVWSKFIPPIRLMKS